MNTALIIGRFQSRKYPSFNPKSSEKRVIIAVPVNILFEEKTLSVCFMEIDMQEMLSGVSLRTNTDNATFCNIYTESGTALTDFVLGGHAMEDNLLNAMKIDVIWNPLAEIILKQMTFIPVK